MKLLICKTPRGQGVPCPSGWACIQSQAEQTISSSDGLVLRAAGPGLPEGDHRVVLTHRARGLGEGLLLAALAAAGLAAALLEERRRRRRN